ncbi:LuxR C-terminal-related transcriptional regulator [Rhizobium sullae]|uniref:DNA-binding protein n=1 Tax=Rhizobium sullae TaxID=50338 RepID=A0A2N0D5S6_RHISU|nr:LuxR C-terminal-related transcriptional regulator [Rhizobium sullae]PKA41438.1 DNA-binding protein [Rhizobium sullae]UWU13075.1 LuxR C-terminal-related transcriptional regulator [Rhizobium sullae]
MTRRERAAHKYADDNAFPLSTAVRTGELKEELKRRLESMVKAAGFDYYLFAAFPRGDSTAFLENRIASNWPQNLTNLYGEADLFYCSRLVGVLKRTIMPVFCDAGPFAGDAANQENRRLNALFRMHGLQNTFGFSLHDADLKQYMFAFSGSRAALSREEEMDLFYAAMEALDRFSSENRTDEGPPENLTRREIECLRWSAAGKSSDEIAIILDLSSHTVVGYLKGAMRKLDSVNRMQAVARAFRYRLL